MVIDRSELSRSRTGIHGGLRRGAAAAAVGAVLVLSAGVPASQAADGSTDPTEPVRLAAGTDLTSGDGLLKGLLGGSGDYSVTASPEPSPSSPSTTAPATTAPATTAPAATAPVTTAPAPTATAAPVPTSAPPSSVAAPQGAAPAAAVPPSSVPAPQTPVPGTGAPANGSGTQAGQPGAPVQTGDAAPEDAGHPGTTSGQPTPRRSEATPVSGPKRSGNAAASQQQMGSAGEAEPAIEAAKIWLGVGLVGSAGAAGLLFARIRRI